MTVRLDVIRDNPPPRAWERLPVLPERHRWNVTRCATAYVAMYKVPGKKAVPITAHPVRMSERSSVGSVGTGCRYHIGQIYVDARHKARLIFCALFGPGPYRTAKRHVVAALFRAGSVFGDRNLDFENVVLRRGKVYGALAIESPMTYEALWFSTRTGIPS